MTHWCQIPCRSLRLAVFFVFCVALIETALAGVRTRELPALVDGRIEIGLVERAASSVTGRVHAIVEVEKSSHRALEASGIELLRSIDANLWLASLPADRTSEGDLPTEIRRVWDLKPADRCLPRLSQALLEPGTLRGTLKLRIKVFRDEPLEPVRTAVKVAGGRVLAEAGGLGVLDVEVPGAALEMLTSRDDVRWVEPSPPPYELAADGARADALIDTVHDLGLSGAGVTIGAWDSGAPDLHPDIAGRVTNGEPGLFTTVHSTHVAGLAIGDGSNSVVQGGTPEQWKGVATGSQLIAYSIDNELAEIDSAIQNHDMDISTNSWVYPVSEAMGNCGLYGNYTNDAPEYDDIVRGIYGKEVVVVFAAGNERDDADCGLVVPQAYNSIPPPGTAKNVITVGAHHSDLQFMTPFSSWGPMDDGRMKPDMTAPGCQASGDLGVTSTGIAGGTYHVICGTSQATPIVAGAAALLLEEWRARFPSDPKPSTIKALLGGFADDRAMAGPDYRFGLGAIQVKKSVDELQTATTHENVLSSGALDVFNFTVPAAANEVKVTLAWDDPPGAELADTTLVNDLDVRLIDPNATLHLPFVLDPANPDSLAVPGDNAVDNVEQIVVSNPTPGNWTVLVDGAGIVTPTQVYSLVGYDSRAPAAVASFFALTWDDTTASLLFLRPEDADRKGSLMVRSQSPITWTPRPGNFYSVGATPAPDVEVVLADDGEYWTTPFFDSDLLPGKQYFYAVFPYDEVPNYAPGSYADMTTTTNAVDAPVFQPPVAELGFQRIGANPFRDRTEFRFDLPRASRVSLNVFDTTGRKVRTVIAGERKVGSHSVAWDGRDTQGLRVAAGVYFVQFQTDGFVRHEKVVVLR